MKQANFYDWTGDRGFYAVCSEVGRRRARRQHTARVRRVRGWMYRRAARQAVREVVREWPFQLLCTLLISLWLVKLFY